VTDARETVRAVVRLTALLALGLATLLALVGRPADAAGTLVGAALVLANLGGLSVGIGRLVGRGEVGRGRRALWMGATGLRLLLVAAAVALLASQGWVGLPGLLLALVAYPFAVVAAGLAAARAA
jgi:hypothetical protein